MMATKEKIALPRQSTPNLMRQNSAHVLMYWRRRDSSPTPSVLGSEGDGLTPSQRRQRQAMEYGEEDAEVETEEVQLHEARTVIPNLPLPSGSDGNVCLQL